MTSRKNYFTAIRDAGNFPQFFVDLQVCHRRRLINAVNIKSQGVSPMQTAVVVGQNRAEGVRAEKRDRDAEIEKETFRRQRHHQSHHQTDDGVDAETSLSLSLHLYLSSPPLHFILTLTFGQ